MSEIKERGHRVQTADSTYTLLLDVLPKEVSEAAELLALPHWLDDALAKYIVGSFLDHNHKGDGVVSDVKQLPFVFPYEEHSWRFVRSARAYLLQRLKQRDGTYRELNQSLVEYFQAARRRVTNGHESEARELDWRIAYHLAPQDAESSVRQLEQLLVDATVAEGGLADMKAVVDLCEEQKAWLERHEVEVAFFTGQYAYALGDYRKAEACFGVVWEKGHPSRIKAIAGHLLGVIWARRARGKEKSLLDRAERVMRESLQLGTRLQIPHHVAQVLNSLGGVLAAGGDKSKLAVAEGYYRQSLQTLRRLGDAHGAAKVLNSLGGVLVAMGGSNRLQKAASYYHQSLDILKEIGDVHGQAMVLNSLGEVLITLSGENWLSQSKQYLTQGVDLLRMLEDARGEAMVLLNLSRLAERSESISLACDYMEKVISINESLGLTRNVTQSRARLRRLQQMLR